MCCYYTGLLTAVVCDEERIYLLSNKNTNDGQLKTAPVICCLVGTSKVCPDGWMDGWMASANRGVKMTPKECLFCVCLHLGSNLLNLYCMVTVAVTLVQTSEDALEHHCFFITNAVIDIRLCGTVCVFVCS